MALGKPDPRFSESRKARSNFVLALRLSLAFVGVLWAIFIIDAVFALRLGQFGLRPGSVPGLIGVVTAPLLHGSFQHLLSNVLAHVPITRQQDRRPAVPAQLRDADAQ